MTSYACASADASRSRNKYARINVLLGNREISVRAIKKLGYFMLVLLSVYIAGHVTRFNQSGCTVSDAGITVGLLITLRISRTVMWSETVGRRTRPV